MFTEHDILQKNHILIHTGHLQRLSLSYVLFPFHSMRVSYSLTIIAHDVCNLALVLFAVVWNTAAFWNNQQFPLRPFRDAFDIALFHVTAVQMVDVLQ